MAITSHIARTRLVTEETIKAIERHLASSDEIALLLKGHLWAEALLVDTLTACLDFPEEFPLLARMGFLEKVQLAKALGAVFWTGSLVHLNGIRNKVGRRPEFEITEATVKGFFASFEPDFGQIENGDPRKRPKYDNSKSLDENLQIALVGLFEYLQVCQIEALKVKNRELKRQTKALKRLIKKEAAQKALSGA